MPIKNYTTKVDAYTSIGEIQGALAKSGAKKVMIDYDGGKPVSITFALEGSFGLKGFQIPAPVEGTLRVFQKQKLDERLKAIVGEENFVPYDDRYGKKVKFGKDRVREDKE